MRKIKSVKSIIVTLLLITLWIKASSQSIFIINEVTENGKEFSVEPKTKQTLTGKQQAVYPNIDINSTLSIKLNKDIIMEQAGKWLGTKGTLPLEKIKGLSEILIKRDEIISKMRADKTDSLKMKLRKLNEVSTFLTPLLEFIVSLPENDIIRIKANEIFSHSEEDATITYTKIFDLIQTAISSTLEEYQAAVTESKVYFRMGAFINNNHVHLDGFDIYKEGEYYKVARFATSIAPEEKKKFDEYKRGAQHANINTRNALSAELMAQLKPMLASLEATVVAKFVTPMADAKAIVDSIKEISFAVKNEVAQVKEDYLMIEKTIKELRKTIENVNDTMYVLSITSGIEAILEKMNKTEEDLKKAVKDLRFVEGERVENAANKIFDLYNVSNQAIHDAMAALKSAVNPMKLLNLQLSQKIEEAFQKLGAEVTKIPLDNIPEETSAKLVTAGARKEGDKLYLKAVLGKRPPELETDEEKTIEYLPLTLYQIGLHSTIKAVLLFVDNTSQEYPTGRQFQLDPSYSVLFKYGMRKHPLYNSVFEAGLGLNMATLDFNNDNIPEIGVGVMVSGFRDYLQIGYGRNMTMDQNYWMLGLRLPFIGFNLTGGAKVISEEK